jgi:hypothetical protein
MHKHPFHEYRQHAVEKSRVGHITKCYAAGGTVRREEAEEAAPTAQRAKRGGMMAEGKKAKHRADRVQRARGGRTKGKGATHVNVIIGGQKDNNPMPVPVPAPAPGGGPPMPPPAMDAGVGPRIGSPVPGGGPMPMIPRKSGGRVKNGPAYDEGIRAGTQVQHSDGKGATNTKANLDRGRPITFKSGGKVVSFHAKDKAVGAGSLAQHKKEHAAMGLTKRATGGRTEAPPYGEAMGPKLPGGAGTGESRIAQAGRARSRYAKPMKETNGAR